MTAEFRIWFGIKELYLNKFRKYNVWEVICLGITSLKSNLNSDFEGLGHGNVAFAKARKATYFDYAFPLRMNSVLWQCHTWVSCILMKFSCPLCPFSPSGLPNTSYIHVHVYVCGHTIHMYGLYGRLIRVAWMCSWVGVIYCYREQLSNGHTTSKQRLSFPQRL